MRTTLVRCVLPLLVVACGKSDSTSAHPASSAEAPAVSASASPAASGETLAASASAVASSSAAPAASTPADAGAVRADPSRLKLEGRVAQGGLVHATVEKGTKGIHFVNHRVIIADEGDFLIAFPREAPKQETLTVTFPDGAVLDHVFDIEQRVYETDKIDNLPKEEVDLDPATKKKVGESNERIDAVRSHFTTQTCWRNQFAWPLKGKITSRYGQPRVLNGKDAGPHWGVDIAAAAGTPVRAPTCGTVVLADADVPLSGNVIVIDHGHGLTTTYLHLKSFTVKVGAVVKAGDVLGTVGMTGRANGPHLDWRMSLFETRIDPEMVAPPMDAKAAK